MAKGISSRQSVVRWTDWLIWNIILILVILVILQPPCSYNGANCHELWKERSVEYKIHVQGHVVSVHCLHWIVVNMYNTANKLNRCLAG